MLVPAQEEELGKDLIMPSAPRHTLIIQPSTYKPQKKKKPKKPRRQDTQETQPSGPIDEALNEENVPIQYNDPPFLRVNTLRSGVDSLKLKELMEICTNLQQRVIDLENTKTVQAQEISNLKKRVKRLEKKRRSRTHGLKRSYKIGLSARVKSSPDEQILGEKDASKQGKYIADIDADADITLVDETAEDQGRYDDQEMFNTNTTTAGIEETLSIVALITTVDVTPDELTMAQALMEIKKSKPKGATTTTTVTIPTPDSTRPKARGFVMQEPSETPTTTTIPMSSKVQDKGKDRLVEEKEKAQLIEDENLAWDNVQAMMDADYELAVRLQEEEAEEQRRKPLTKAQKRNQMCVYLKNMAGFTHSKLKNKIFDEVQKAFDKTITWINSFVPMESEVVKDKTMLTQERSSRAGDKLDQGRSKKQKVEDDKEQEELKRCLEIILDDGDDVTIDATPLSIKNLIIDYKIYKEGKKSYF
uniref:Uncharacterized protein n=1 Tax=Tanacetum cinerariifolium TaxID=118510 RepID=A0A6L2L5H0_TANCI|nr:hypothetical protein [Tanacetum cinerariifolium]